MQEQLSRLGKGGGDADPSGLALTDGGELLVEEQGAASNLIMVESTSLADMEVMMACRRRGQ